MYVCSILSFLTNISNRQLFFIPTKYSFVLFNFLISSHMLTFFFDMNELSPKQEQRICNNENKIIY
jgi:flagellar biosynthesis protein FliQ